MANRIWLSMIICLLISEALTSQSVFGQLETPLAPAAAIDGEDASVLKMLFERWDKQPKIAKLSGQVFDGKGAPAARAKFVAIFFDPGVRAAGMTYAEGKFAFSSPSPLGRGIYFESEDGKSAVIMQEIRLAGEKAREIEARLAPMEELTFDVKSAKGGKVTGANCGLLIDTMIVARGRADDQGKVTLQVPKLLPPMDRSAETRMKALYGFGEEEGLGFGVFLDGEGERETPSELVLNEARPVKVQVRDRQGKGLAGLPVMVYAMRIATTRSRSMGAGGATSIAISYQHVPMFDETRGFAKSDANGDAVLSWFAPPKLPSAPGAFFAENRSDPTLVGAIHPEWGVGQNAFENKSPPKEIVCTIYSPTRIYGRVLLPGGEPAAGIQLATIEPGHMGATRSVTTNAKGKYEFVTPLIEGDIKVVDKKWVASAIAIGPIARSTAEKQIDVQLREGRVVRFRVTSGPEYAIAANFDFGVISKGKAIWLKTDAHGRAEAALEQGLYRVEAHHPTESVYKMDDGSDQFLINDQADIEIPVHMHTKPLRKIKVSVFHSDGTTAYEKAKVQLINLAPENNPVATRPEFSAEGIEGNDGLPSAAFTDVGGNTEIQGLVAAPLGLLVTGSDGERTVTSVDVLINECRVVLKPGITIKGRLLNERSGEPIGEVEIIAKFNLQQLAKQLGVAPNSITGNRGVDSVVFKGSTDAMGNFDISDVPPDAPLSLSFQRGFSGPASGRGGFGGGRPALPLGAVPGGPPGMFSGMTGFSGRSIKDFQSAKEGTQDLGELKVTPPPMRAAPRAAPLDPNRR